jgi:16S rRNA (cytidine1402-2'-O)-methyltransferase
MVFFEAPHRVAATLAAMAQAFGPARRAAVCRELTKTYEEVRRGDLSDLATWADAGVKGEITIVVEGAGAAPAVRDATALAQRVAEHEASGTARKDAIAAVMAETGARRREVYDAVLAHKSSTKVP